MNQDLNVQVAITNLKKSVMDAYPLELEQIKELHPEGVKTVQDWMKKWFNSAGYKRLGKILADKWEEPC